MGNFYERKKKNERTRSFLLTMVMRRASLGVRVLFFLMATMIQQNINSAAAGTPIDQIGPLFLKEESLERNIWRAILVQPRIREWKGEEEGGDLGVWWSECGERIWRFSWWIGGNTKSWLLWWIDQSFGFGSDGS